MDLSKLKNKPVPKKKEIINIVLAQSEPETHEIYGAEETKDEPSELPLATSLIIDRRNTGFDRDAFITKIKSTIQTKVANRIEQKREILPTLAEVEKVSEFTKPKKVKKMRKKKPQKLKIKPKKHKLKGKG